MLNHGSLLHCTFEDSDMLDDRRVNDIAYFACLILEQGALSGKYGMRRITQGIKF